MLNSWKDHKFILFSHEFWRPFLAVWMFFRDILMYIFDLFKMSWKALPSAMNKNAIIPSFIASVSTCVLFYFSWFVIQILIANEVAIDPDNLAPWFGVFSIIASLPMCWGLATVASVIKAKAEDRDDSWRKHTSVGFKGVRFFLTYVLVVVALFLAITILSSIGLMPMIGKPILAILSVPFYFASMIIVLCAIGLFIGSHLFGGFYLSGDYDESASFKNKTVSLFKMVACKVIDFIAVQMPAGIMMFLFVIFPTVLMLLAVDIMQLPGKDFYDIRWPNVYTAFANTNQYPAENEEAESDLLNLAFSTDYEWRYPTVEAAAFHYAGDKKKKIDGLAKQLQNGRKMIQDGYPQWRDRKDYDGKQPNKGKDLGDYVSNLNEGAIEAYSYSGDQLILLQAASRMPNGEDGSCYVSTDEIECSGVYDSNHIWSMDGAGNDVSFSGESHPSFFIWLITLILVFVCSIVVSIPLGCLYSAGAAIYYNLYITDYNKKYGFVKRFIVVLFPLIFLLGGLLGGMAITNGFGDSSKEYYEEPYSDNNQELDFEFEVEFDGFLE